MPCDYRQYHPDWKSIRRQILDQANHCCEFCGLANGIYGVRWDDGSFHELGEDRCDATGTDSKPCIRIVLTIAHLDHDISNNDPCNLRALCQRCHLRWDRDHHLKNWGITRRNKQVMAGQQGLL